MEECKRKIIVHIYIHIYIYVYTFAYQIEGIHGDEMRKEEKKKSAGDCVI